MDTIKVENVQKKIQDKVIIKDVTFSVQRGRTFVLLGPNGAGKTTIIRLLTGLLQPTKGSISIFGQTLSDSNVDVLRNKIGVQNDGSLYERLSIEDNLMLWGKLYGMTSVQCDQRITELLSFFALTERRAAKVGSLSKGMQQKVAIARALLHNPEILILDEPTAGLDPIISDALLTHLGALTRMQHMTIIMTTHQLQGLEKLADDLAIIRNGEIVIAGNTEELLSNTWKDHTFIIETENIKKAYEVCASFHPKHLTMDRKIYIEVNKREDIFPIIASITEHKIGIYSVEQQRHTLQELYFTIMEERV